VDLAIKLGTKVGVVGRIPRGPEGAAWGRRAASLLLAGLILGYPTFTAYRYVDANKIMALTIYDDPQLPSLMKVYSWLSTNVPEGTRVDWPHFSGGILYHFVGSVMFAGRPTVFIWNPETTGRVFDYLHPVYDGVWFPLFAQDADPARFNMTDVYSRLRTVGVGVLVTEVPNVKAALDLYPRLFERVRDVDGFTIFYLKDPEPSYVKVLSGQGVQVESVEVEPEQIRFVVRGCKPETEILVKVSHFPNWKVFVNDREIKVRADDTTGLMRLTLDEIGDVRVTLVYASLWFEQVGTALTIVFVLAFLLVLMPEALTRKAVVRLSHPSRR
jgi:hypothetical protein